ncbi:hypothetical protein HU200_005420 [Digitaria exilis]|uniref:Uncharacterized protein n=1 Tax=Digitaria exilis TaxID=1010633 RepID=A0A835FRN8_9POAL|nr:hypothetical protein HU200_005420 [Digitaria exilis]
MALDAETEDKNRQPSIEKQAVDLPRLDPRKAMLGSNDTRLVREPHGHLTRPPGYKKRPVAPPLPAIVPSSNQTEMATVRPFAVALLACAATFLVASVSSQLMDPGQPDSPIMSDPNVIPVYMSPGSAPTYVTCYGNTHGQQGSQPFAPPAAATPATSTARPGKLVCLCELTGTECYDPRFVGGDGNKFLFHGRRDADFCLLSRPPTCTSTRTSSASSATPWPRAPALGIRFGVHRLYLGVRRTSTWDATVDRLVITFDGAPVPLDAVAAASWSPTATAPALSIFRTGPANGVVVRLDGVFRIVVNAVPVTEEDSRAHGYGVGPEDGSLVHLNVAFKFYAITADVHGVLGQTYRPGYVSSGGVDVGARVPVMGGADRYQVSDIFATDCEVGRFAGDDGGLAAGHMDIIEEPADALCGSGKGGAGLARAAMAGEASVPEARRRSEPPRSPSETRKRRSRRRRRRRLIRSLVLLLGLLAFLLYCGGGAAGAGASCGAERAANGGSGMLSSSSKIRRSPPHRPPCMAARVGTVVPELLPDALRAPIFPRRHF